MAEGITLAATALKKPIEDLYELAKGDVKRKFLIGEQSLALERFIKEWHL